MLTEYKFKQFTIKQIECRRLWKSKPPEYVFGIFNAMNKRIEYFNTEEECKTYINKLLRKDKNAFYPSSPIPSRAMREVKYFSGIYNCLTFPNINSDTVNNFIEYQESIGKSYSVLAVNDVEVQVCDNSFTGLKPYEALIEHDKHYSGFTINDYWANSIDPRIRAY